MTTADRSPAMGVESSTAVLAGVMQHPPTQQPAQAQYVPLAQEHRPNVDTAAAAYYLNRRAQTLRCWAIYDNGPIRPLRIHGRLAWPVARIKELNGISAE